MRKTSKIIIAVLILAILLLGIGYAAIQNITLNINGTAAADPSQSNFKVMFTGTPTVSDSTYVTAAITNDTNATINVEGLNQKGQTVSAEYTVQNVSTDISSDLSVSTTNSNTEYFTLKSELAKTSLVAGEATTVTVTVELTKTPISEKVTSTIGVQLTAMPVEPGKEGTSEGMNGSSQTPSELTIGDITNANIGEYIDLGNNIIGTESTSDDWRILYKDGDRVYAILADYLPADQVPESAGLSTNSTQYPYSVYSNTDRDTLINILNKEIAWSSFANGINGATATGTPTAELLINSYNTKNGTNLEYTNNVSLNSTTKDYDLYVPHTEAFSDCYGYRLASPHFSYSDRLMFVHYSGNLGDRRPVETDAAIRPVVSLSYDIKCTYADGVWKVTPETNTGEIIVKKTVGDITNDNIGEYINLGNNIVGTESTSDDWRILYKDGDTVYAILADYLPASQVPASAGLTTNPTSYPYSVWSDKDYDTLVNGLKNETAWSSFASGITGVTVTGTPTVELLMSSYNTKNGTELVYTDVPTLDSTLKDYNLYVPHTSAHEDCYSYLLLVPNEMWYMNCSGRVDNYFYHYTKTSYAIRPVVSLQSNITCTYANGVWTIEK